MIRLIIIFWNVLISVAPSSQPESKYVNPLHGYHMQAKSVDAHQHVFALIINEISSDSDDSDDSEDNDDNTDETAYIHKILIHSELVDLQRKQKSVFEYLGRLSQAHINPIITPPDSHTRNLFIA